jgi:hypothetical protein
MFLQKMAQWNGKGLNIKALAGRSPHPGPENYFGKKY